MTPRTEEISASRREELTKLFLAQAPTALSLVQNVLDSSLEKAQQVLIVIQQWAAGSLYVALLGTLGFTIVTIDATERHVDPSAVPHQWSFFVIGGRRVNRRGVGNP